MKNKPGVFLFLVIILISLVSASCNKTRIDINSASLERLDELAGIGPAKAQAIIDARPFDSLEDLINVYGIGNATLEKIKSQKLACVEEPYDEETEIEEENSRKEEEEIEEVEENKQYPEIKKVEKIELEPIVLTSSKSIKSEENTESSKENLALCGIVLLGIFFGAWFFLKKMKYRNEFN